MKVIFLDIDGVLNSSKYFTTKESRNNSINVTRIPFLKQIVNATGAVIVLVSSWKCGWSKDYSQCNDEVKKLINLLAEYDLKILDRTSKNMMNRADEIEDWLSRNLDIESFVVIDDDRPDYNGIKFMDRWVRTSWYIGDGLNSANVKQAIKLLNGGCC